MDSLEIAGRTYAPAAQRIVSGARISAVGSGRTAAVKIDPSAFVLIRPSACYRPLVTTILGEGKVVLGIAQKAVKVARWAEVSPAVQARLERSIDGAKLDAIKVCYSVCKALVAQALGREPSSQEVNDYMEAAVDDPAFPNRAYRLLGEIHKSASRRRREFLASALFGLPFRTLPDDERDRIDMTIERLTVDDAELLMVILDNKKTPQDLGHNLFGPTGVLVMTYADLQDPRPNVYIVTPDFSGETDECRHSVPRGLFESLKLLGCAEVGTAMSKDGGWYRHPLMLTRLGEMVGRAIGEVRHGVADKMTPSAAAQPPTGNRRRR